MKALTLFLAVAAAWILAPDEAGAKGGGLQPKPNKDFRELIVRGERPEIAACMVAAIDYARHDGSFSAIRWDEGASDRAIMRESEVDGKLMRTVRILAQMRGRNSGLFSDKWQPVEISCDQPEDGAIQVHVQPTTG